MPDATLQKLNAELKVIEETRSNLQAAGATSISGLDQQSNLISLANINKDRYRVLREIRTRQRELAGVDRLGGQLSFTG